MPDPLISLLAAVVILGFTAVLLWPERGLLPRWRQANQLTGRVRSEDALKHIHKCEMKGRRPTLDSIAGALQMSQDNTAALLANMQASNLLEMEEGEIHLTPQGRDSALHIIRVHRLWEQYLAEETGFDQEDWHGLAEQVEHRLSPAEADALAAQLGHPTHDPHGDPIPTASGELVAHGGQPLASLPVDTPGLIVHLEDEPGIVFAQITAEGLHPGMVVRITEATPERVRFWTNGDEHVLAPIVANNVSVVPLPEETETDPPDWERLTSLEPGETAVVVSIANTSRGMERRRFMDLGILPGTKITADMRSPSGDPTAYQIRGALIALRQEQANLIKIRRQKSEE